jgi:hypothetical protein
MKGKRETITPDTPPSMAKLIARCWEGRAAQRPMMDEAVKVLRENQAESIAKANPNPVNSVNSRRPLPTPPAIVGSSYRANVASANATKNDSLKPPAPQTTTSSDYRPNLMSN